MNIENFIITFNRPKIASASIQSLLGNTKVPIRQNWIIDDCSELEFKTALFNFSVHNKINFMSHGRNMGIGYTFERVYNLINQSEDLDIACIIESDYLWRKGWLEDIVAVFESDKNIIGFSGTDHPDMYDIQKTHNTFPNLMYEQFGRDLSARDNLYKPYEVNTKLGKIKVQGVSNSCGCMIINWKRLKIIIKELNLEKDYWQYMDRAFNKGITHDTRKNASDAYMSQTISMFSEMHMKANNIDITKNFGFVSICDYAISQHVCGQGINGMIAKEGETFINSPTWNDEYLNKNPRINESI